MSSDIPQICPYCKEDLANAWHDSVGVNVVYECGTYQIKHLNSDDFTDSKLCTMGVIELQAKIDFLIDHCSPSYPSTGGSSFRRPIRNELDLRFAMILTNNTKGPTMINSDFTYYCEKCDGETEEEF